MNWKGNLSVVNIFESVYQKGREIFITIKGNI